MGQKVFRCLLLIRFPSNHSPATDAAFMEWLFWVDRPPCGWSQRFPKRTSDHFECWLFGWTALTKVWALHHRFPVRVCARFFQQPFNMLVLAAQWFLEIPRQFTSHHSCRKHQHRSYSKRVHATRICRCQESGRGGGSSCIPLPSEHCYRIAFFWAVQVGRTSCLVSGVLFHQFFDD